MSNQSNEHYISDIGYISILNINTIVKVLYYIHWYIKKNQLSYSIGKVQNKIMKFWIEEFLPFSQSFVSESFFLLQADSQKLPIYFFHLQFE